MRYCCCDAIYSSVRHDVLIQFLSSCLLESFQKHDLMQGCIWLDGDVVVESVWCAGLRLFQGMVT